MPALSHWPSASESHGETRLGISRDTRGGPLAGHHQALREELACWDQGRRDPDAISETWGYHWHAGEVASRVLALRHTSR